MITKRERKYRTRQQKLNPAMVKYPGMQANAVKAVGILNRIKVHADDRPSESGDISELQEE